MRISLRPPTRAAAALVLAGCAVDLWEGRHATFVADEWDFIMTRRGFGADVFLRAHNEHLSALPVAAYKLMLAVFGMTSYLPFLCLLMLVHALACTLLYLLARRYVGPWVAIAPAAILAVLGPAWADLLWAFQVGFVGSVAAGLAMALCLERQDRSGDLAASGLLLVSILCSSVFIPFAVLGVVIIALQRPRDWRRLWVITAPLALYALWYVGYGTAKYRPGNLDMVPSYVWRALSAAVASATGTAGGGAAGYPGTVAAAHGELIAGSLILLLVVSIIRRRGAPALTWAASAAVLALWIAEALEYTPGREADNSRYQYAAVVLLLLVASSALRGWRPRGGSVAIIGIATAAICASNLVTLDRGAEAWSRYSSVERAQLGVLQVARKVVTTPSLSQRLFASAVLRLRPPLLRPGSYFRAVQAFGSSADTPAQLLSQAEPVREGVDQLIGLVEHVAPAAAGPSGRPDGNCLPTSSSLAGVVIPFGRFLIVNGSRSAQVLELRRFATRFRLLRWSISPGGSLALRLPRDGSTVPWVLRVGGPEVRVCPA